MTKPLTNQYAKEYYDAQVASLSSYESQRWHSSPVRKFEYRQTTYSLDRALKNIHVGRALEIGPGDGVWTSLIHSHAQQLHLVEQSVEMLTRAKARLSKTPGITFEHSDFQTSNPPGGNGLIAAIRCFEYFEDKKAALHKMKELLAPSGRIIIVTKNPQMLTSEPVQGQTLHSGQISPKEMRHLCAQAGLQVDFFYPAILRFKARYALMRVLFGILHRLAVWSRGKLIVPFLTSAATESYAYVLVSNE